MLKMMVGSVYSYSFHFHMIYHLAIPISTTLFFLFFYFFTLSHFWVIIDIFFKGVLLVCQIWLYSKMAEDFVGQSQDGSSETWGMARRKLSYELWHE